LKLLSFIVDFIRALCVLTVAVVLLVAWFGMIGLLVLVVFRLCRMLLGV